MWLFLEALAVSAWAAPWREMVALEPRESFEQAEADTRTGLRAHHKTTVGLPALPHRTGRQGYANHCVSGARRAVPPQRRSDSEGSRVLRRVWRARRGLLRQRPPPA